METKRDRKESKLECPTCHRRLHVNCVSCCSRNVTLQRGKEHYGPEGWAVGHAFHCGSCKADFAIHSHPLPEVLDEEQGKALTCPTCKKVAHVVCVYCGSGNVTLSKGPKGLEHYGTGGATGHHFHYYVCQGNFAIHSDSLTTVPLLDSANVKGLVDKLLTDFGGRKGAGTSTG